MERIYTIIQREKMRRVSNEVLAVQGKKKDASAEGASTFRNQEILNCLNVMPYSKTDTFKPQKRWYNAEKRKRRMGKIQRS